MSDHRDHPQQNQNQPLPKIPKNPIFSTKTPRTFEVQQLTNIADSTDESPLEQEESVSGDASNSTQMEKGALFTTPMLHRAKSEWYIDFYFCVNGRKQRFKRSDGLNKIVDPAEREKEAEKLILKFDSQLRSGWNPMTDTRRIQVIDHLQYHRDRKKVKDPEHNLRFLFSMYLDEMQKVVKLRDKSITTYKTKLRMFEEWVGVNYSTSFTIVHVTKDMCLNFSNDLRQGKVTGKAVAGRTYNSYIGTLKQVWNWYDAKNEHLGLINHWRKIKPQKKIQKRKYPFTKEQEELIFNHLQQTGQWELWLICQLIFRSFIRPGREMHCLLVSDIDFIENKIWMRSDISKNKKTQSVPLPSLVKEKLMELNVHNANPLHYVFGKSGVSATPAPIGHWSKQFTKIVRALGIPPGQTIYTFKDAGNQRAHANLMPPKKQQELNRHHSLDQMLTYLEGMKGVNQEEHDKYFE